ncbi:hypothetical protein ACFT2C_11465 [Promicromonospora sp. NPDC057138]|uniref:hypothetical protein n=1 Tax=Promicromonospora sp. NPDC057138 TaxID=3346031 RepID=UPI003628AA44
MTEQNPVVPKSDGDASAAERAVLRSAARDGLILVAGLAVLGSVVGFLVGGLPGLVIALIGAGVVAVFCGTTVWSMWATVGKPLPTLAAVVMGSWIAKVVVLIAVLTVLKGTVDEWLTPGVRGVVLGVVAIGAIGTALLDYRAVRNGRVPYVGD